jgi:hypothetical protein
MVAALRSKPGSRSTPSLSMAMDTVEFVAQRLALDATRYGSHWRRTVLPLPLAVCSGCGPDRPGFGARSAVPKISSSR